MFESGHHLPLPEQPFACRSCSSISCDPRKAHDWLNCLYHNLPLFLPAADCSGELQVFQPALCWLKQMENKTRTITFLTRSHFLKTLFPCVENLGLTKISFSEGKAVCYPLYFKENVPSAQHAINMFTYMCEGASFLL